MGGGKGERKGGGGKGERKGGGREREGTEEEIGRDKSNIIKISPCSKTRLTSNKHSQA